MNKAREEYLHDLWDEETDDPETQEWREELTAEEQKVVDLWDDQYDVGMLKLCTAVVIRDEIHKVYQRKDILELVDVPGGCRMRLRDGSLYLAMLASDNTLRLSEIDAAC